MAGFLTLVLFKLLLVLAKFRRFSFTFRRKSVLKLIKISDQQPMTVYKICFKAIFSSL